MRACRWVLLGWLAVQPLASLAEDWQYTIRPGDEIWNLARKYCGSTTFADRIIEHNGIANERGLRPGDRLRIPVEWLVKQPAAAEIVKVRGQASLFVPEPRPAEVGGVISMGHRLATTDGSAVVRFADESTLTVGPDTDVLFNVLTAYGDTGMVDTHLRFYRGRGTSKILRRDAASRYRISSPVGTAAVRGTEFRVAVSAERSITETLEGVVGFVQTSETTVPQGYGAAAVVGGIATEPLLEAPVWTSAAGRYGPADHLDWQGLAGASRYRVAVFESTEPDTPVLARELDGTSFPLLQLPSGRYAVSVRGISAADIEGYDASLDVEVATPAPEATAAAIYTQDDVRLTWRATESGAPYEVQVAEDEAFERIVAEETVTESGFEPTLLPGRYHWRISDATSVFSAPTVVSVRPRAPDVSVDLASRRIEAAWPAISEAEAYRVRIHGATVGVVSDSTLTETSFSERMPSFGDYTVEVTVTVNGVESLPAQQTVRLAQSRWWLLALLALPLLL
jgi:hypothetical protein